MMRYMKKIISYTSVVSVLFSGAAIADNYNTTITLNTDKKRLNFIVMNELTDESHNISCNRCNTKLSIPFIDAQSVQYQEIVSVTDNTGVLADIYITVPDPLPDNIHWAYLAIKQYGNQPCKFTFTSDTSQCHLAPKKIYFAKTSNICSIRLKCQQD